MTNTHCEKTHPLSGFPTLLSQKGALQRAAGKVRRPLEISLKKQLRQQELMCAISQSFMTAQNTRDLINSALKTAGEFMCVNQAFLSRYDKDAGVLECLYEWVDKNGRPYIGSESRWPIAPDMEIFHDLSVKGYAAVSDYAALTHPNFLRVKDHALKAFLNISLDVSGEFWGVVGFIINTHTYQWTASDIHLGKLLAGVFSGVVSRNEAEENLLKAKEEAERASRAKGEFLSRMSHEIRTPVNAIIGMAGIAKKATNPQKVAYCLDMIDNSSKHLLGLINDILDISKIEANKLEISPAEFDFEKMLMNIANVVNFRVEEKKQNLIINIAKDMPPVLIGDEMRLGQVISNLLSNAAKFTPESGTITLNVKIEDMADGVYTLLFDIIDTGIGISQEQRTRLFAPFEQADGGIARRYGGTGLGLNISRSIVELMGGRIWVESELGHGSKFSFTVKMCLGGESPRQEISNMINIHEIRALAVAGAPALMDYFAHMLPQLGLACDVAPSGADALGMMGCASYQLCFVDWMLKDMEGIDLIKQFRGMGCCPAIIMIIPQNDWNNIEKEAQAANVSHFLFKPLFPSSLIGAINGALGTAPQEVAAAALEPVYDFSGHCLLAAEDIAINREILYAILEDTHISIEFAYDGVQALSLFEANPEKYTLILMDIQMPEMDGYEAAEKIRASSGPHAKTIPIIAMTANVFREDVDRCIESGMNGHIGKPLDTFELLGRLSKYLCPETPEMNT